MEDSKKPELFTFGKFKTPEDSNSEESLSDTTDEDSVSEKQGKDISSKTNENHQNLIREMERLTCRAPSDFSAISSSASSDFFERRNCNGSDTGVRQLRPRYGDVVKPERRRLFGMGQRLRGNWSLRCDTQEKDSDGLTEADIVWTAITELHEKEPRVFTLKPGKSFARDGYASINCHTPDYRDEELILKTGNLLREHVYFPYVMYYYHSDGKLTSIYMHTPNGEFYRKKGNNRWEFVDRE